MKIIFCLFFCVLLIEPVLAEFSLIAVKKSNSVYVNEIFDVPLYITGYGSYKGLIKLSIYVDEVFGIQDLRLYGKDIELRYPNPIRLTRVFNSDIFFRTLTKEECPTCDFPSLTIMGESSITGQCEEGGGYPPFYVRFNVKDKLEGHKINPGDYDINFILMYQDEEGWHSSRETLTIHINSWYEENQRYLVIVALIVAFIALFKIGKNDDLRQGFNLLLFIVASTLVGYVLTKELWVAGIFLIISFVIGLFILYKIHRR